MSTLKLGTIATQDGTESTDVTNVVNGTAKAWVNFNGTGTVAIRRGFNVSSITDNNVGNYTVNFTTAMPDINYSGSFCGNGLVQIPVFYSTTTTYVQVLYYNTAGSGVDNTLCVAAIFR